MLPPSNQRHSICHGKKNAINSLIDGNLGVEPAYRDGVRIGLSWIRDAPEAEHIVEHDEAPGPNQAQSNFVIAVVRFLIGIDEHQVKNIALPLKLIERCDGWTNLEINIGGHAGLLPMWATDP
jgi:hypothetical protein